MNRKYAESDSGKVSIKQGLFWVLLSVLLVSGSCAIGLLYFQRVKSRYAHNDTYRIVALVQTSSGQEMLKTVYLAELLELSVDRPRNLYQFSASDARRKLLASPLIKEATVKKIRPGTLYVDYRLRQPAAFLADYSNTAIDMEGNPFPFKPFFTPKKLPDLYLGLQEGDLSQITGGGWGEPIRGPRAELALILLKLVTENCCSKNSRVRLLDVSQAFVSSYGQRQIVLMLEQNVERELEGKSVLVITLHLLRLNNDTYQEGIANYLVLRDHLEQQMRQEPFPEGAAVIRRDPIIIDLRLPQLAFMTHEKE